MSLTALWYAVSLVLAILQAHSLRSNQHSAELTEKWCMLCAQGKVRDTYRVADSDKLVIVTTDRQSAFDRLLASIPFKVLASYLAHPSSICTCFCSRVLAPISLSTLIFDCLRVQASFIVKPCLSRSRSWVVQCSVPPRRCAGQDNKARKCCDCR